MKGGSAQTAVRLARLIAAVLLVTAGALLAGALLAWPLYAVFAALGSVEYHKAISLSTLMGGLLACYLYLRLTGPADLAGSGLGVRAGDWSRRVPSAFGAAFLLVLLLESSLLLLGAHALLRDQGITPVSITQTFVRGSITGLVIAFIEETLFRGLLFGALQRQGGSVAALVVSSAVYSAAHYLKFPPVEGEVGWFTGLSVLPDAFYRFSDPAIIDSGLSLFVLGILLGLMRIERGNIMQCAGFHAGLVGALGIVDHVSDPVPGSGLAFLINRYDQQLGWLALAWLIFAAVIYVVLMRRTGSMQPGRALN